ncbi:sensor histidine kinase [Curtobacterium sp. VKM Ac-1376]|uniref:sensor histidine kinase n=1 Tax=Curtobacterium sp. VKM Ac-1376 TaxID=123312 RepID=UPI00188B44CD|nr:ATP-binding protein [Curtobacterium sp. VKM Ac-1376]MBF4613832.1 ATP-binding protein [Curtobacterium sp. VKM Ac-1376]
MTETLAGDGLAPFGADPSRAVRATITQASMERVFSILLAVAVIGFGVADAPAVLAQLPYLHPVWGPVSAITVAASFLFVSASAIVPRLAQPAQILCALVFLVALVTWPFTVQGALPDDQVPWPWWLCNVGTIAAALGLATWRATLYNAVVPTVFILIRLSPAGGEAGVTRALLDGVYTAILGGAALVLIVTLRRAAAAVDNAQATAVRRYSAAIREHATEVERVQVDAIVHDSVLTTLLSAARADTLEARTLSARMARNAIDHLAAAADAPEEVAPVRVVDLRRRIAASVSGLGAPLTVARAAPGSDAVSLPAAAADALASAAVQAAVNSVQHAGADVGRWVTIEHDADGAVRVEVGDDGAGFDVRTIPPERLGVRRSIIERMSAVGGAAEIRTAPGAGTTIALTWPAPAPAPEPRSAPAAQGGIA